MRNFRVGDNSPVFNVRKGFVTSFTVRTTLELSFPRKELERIWRRETDRRDRSTATGTLIGLLASTGLRSGEALRLDRADVDLATGVLHIRKTKFRKDRLVPVHPTTLKALRVYACSRDVTFPVPESSAFFIGMRGNRLSSDVLYDVLSRACLLAGLSRNGTRALRPHDLRHRFAVMRLAEWHRQKMDVQAKLPLLATYLGHARYSDTAYYVTATPELLGLAAQRTFRQPGGVA